MLIEERIKKALMIHFKNHREVGLHERIEIRGIMQGTHLMCMGMDPDRAFALSPKERRARVLSMLSPQESLREF